MKSVKAVSTAVGGHDEVDGVIGAALPDAEGQLVVRHGKFFVGHPAGDFANLVDVGVDVARVLDDGRKAVEDGAAGELAGARLSGCDSSFCKHGQSGDGGSAFNRSGELGVMKLRTVSEPRFGLKLPDRRWHADVLG